MLAMNFVLISLCLTSLAAALCWRVPRLRALWTTSKSVPGYAYHTAAQIKLDTRPILPDGVDLCSLEMFHSYGRARLILRCAATDAHHEGAWTEALTRAFLEATGVHVVTLDVLDHASGEIVAQHLSASDTRGWTGDEFDRVDSMTRKV